MRLVGGFGKSGYDERCVLTAKVKPKYEDLGGLSPESLRTQLSNLRDHAAILTAQVRALGGTPKNANDPFDSLTVLERVALTLALADEAASAVQSVPFDPAGHHTPHPNDRAIPGSSTRAARYRRDKLVRTIESAVAAWEGSKHNDFRPIRKQAPMTRCRNEGNCKRANRWVEAWDDKGGANEFCTGCGHRLPPPNDKT